MYIQFKKEWMIPAAIGVVSFGIGIGAGYLLASKRKSDTDDLDNDIEESDPEEWASQLRMDFEQVAEEVDDVEYTIIREDGEEDQVDEDIYEEGGIQYSKRASIGPTRLNHERLPDPENMVNIFINENEDWDYEEEIAKRSPKEPYIIHRDEFYEKGDKPHYSQSTLEYYAGDSILTDDQDVPIYNPQLIVGQLIFGHGSNDPSICYIRNEIFAAEYEVLLNTGFFQEEVLGADVENKLNAPDLKHSLYKFRD